MKFLKRGFWSFIVFLSVNGGASAANPTAAENRRAGIVRCPFSLERMLKVGEDEQVIYHAEHAEARAFPRPGRLDGQGVIQRLSANRQAISRSSTPSISWRKFTTFHVADPEFVPHADF